MPLTGDRHTLGVEVAVASVARGREALPGSRKSSSTGGKSPKEADPNATDQDQAARAGIQGARVP
jgi:hypothetical protein